MLKLKLTSLEGLPADIAKEYKQTDGGFILDTDVNYDEAKVVKDALAAEKQHRKTATTRVTELEDQVKTLEARGASVPELERSWKEKLDKLENGYKEKLTKQDGQLRAVLVDGEALKIATELSSVPELLLPYLTKRMTIVEEDGRLHTRVLDNDGKLTASSLKEFSEEIRADKKFAPIITASKASGGGAQGGQGSAGGKTFDKMNESERTALYKSNPTEYKRQSDAHKASQPAS